ncbi:entericidin A/B family lipoprotein [Cypionkella sp.]|nr:entericidin A/B family lipoprotein [Cypionkella sp.]
MKLRTLFLPLVAFLTLTACETIQGAGRDIEGAGEAITDQSQETQAQM